MGGSEQKKKPGSLASPHPLDKPVPIEFTQAINAAKSTKSQKQYLKVPVKRSTRTAKLSTQMNMNDDALSIGICSVGSFKKKLSDGKPAISKKNHSKKANGELQLRNVNNLQYRDLKSA